MHPIYVWLCFIVGALLYMVKRAFYGIKPPNPVATGPLDYVRRAWLPLIFRLAMESAFFWTLFTPDVAYKLLGYVGLQEYSLMVTIVINFKPAAFVFGLAIDPMADWFIPTIIGKIPVLKELWPQMPGPIVITKSEQA